MDRERVLGVDPGTRFTGWGVIETCGVRHNLIASGVIVPKESLLLEQKYVVIFDGMNEILEKYTPHSFSIETQYVDKSVQSAIKLGMARGVALLAAAKRGIPIFTYSPSEAKKAVTGRGGATKAQVSGMIKLLLNLKEVPASEDETDALALAVAHAHRRKEVCMRM